MKTALIIVDPQNDFCDFYLGNTVGVKDSKQIFPVINKLKEMDRFYKVFITMDEHPSNHVSFA
jgi:nicotinamidase-related amidase